jgi:hypothetical protein
VASHCWKAHNLWFDVSHVSPSYRPSPVVAHDGWTCQLRSRIRVSPNFSWISWGFIATKRINMSHRSCIHLEELLLEFIQQAWERCCNVINCKLDFINSHMTIVEIIISFISTNIYIFTLKIFYLTKLCTVNTLTSLSNGQLRKSGHYLCTGAAWLFFKLNSRNL